MVLVSEKNDKKEVWFKVYLQFVTVPAVRQVKLLGQSKSLS